MAEKFVYTFERPKQFPNANFVWTLGSDSFSNSIYERLGLPFTGLDLGLVIDACNRKPEVVEKISAIEGRSAILPGSEFSFAGVNYDTIEIGGFGYQNFKPFSEKGAVVTVNPREPIQLPNAENFAEKNPSITRTDITTDIGNILIGDDFSFNGAYTFQQAVTKVANNLFLLDKISQENPPSFIVGIPFSIGTYPDIIGPDGKPAHFITWKVPYQGKRLGNVSRVRASEFNVKEFLDALITRGIKISKPLRALHELGLVHNQAHPGNYFVPEDDNPMLLTDFSTLHPVSYKNEDISRSDDLYKNIKHTVDYIFRLSGVYPNSDLLTYLFQNSLVYYGTGYIPERAENLEQVDKLLIESIDRAKRSGQILARDKSYANLRIEQIKKIKKKLLAELANSS